MGGTYLTQNWPLKLGHTILSELLGLKISIKILFKSLEIFPWESY